MTSISTYGLRLVKESTGSYDLDSKFLYHPESVVMLMEDIFDLSEKAEEEFCMLCLNTKNKVIGAFTVSRGSLDSAVVHPREVFKRAILMNSAAIIVAHNHPSGNPEPSQNDLEVTKRLDEAGKILGIQVLDHLIIGDRDMYIGKHYISMKERGIF